MIKASPTIARLGTALVAGLCILALHPDARLTRDVAAQEKPPVFSEVPAPTTRPQPAQVPAPRQ